MDFFIVTSQLVSAIHRFLEDLAIKKHFVKNIGGVQRKKNLSLLKFHVSVRESILCINSVHNNFKMNQIGKPFLFGIIEQNRYTVTSISPNTYFLT